MLQQEQQWVVLLDIARRTGHKLLESTIMYCLHWVNYIFIFSKFIYLYNYGILIKSEYVIRPIMSYYQLPNEPVLC